ncbi:DUF7793 family protein [Confluentibacter sediminis]|uniref:DUF7793 family protein n=1 Tax=Confluentibacter sediminis TaxID=2219045 RepID=UPI000DAE17FF|nr:hypothetical protein [Confluentibacter sediminis]
MLPYFENDYSEYHLRDGILIITYKKGVYMDLKAAVQIVKDRLAMQEGQSLPILCDIQGINEIDKSARNYLAMEGSTLIKSVAFLVKSPVSKMMFKFFLRTNKPPIPIQCFDNLDDAIIFLNKFKN